MKRLLIILVFLAALALLVSTKALPLAALGSALAAFSNRKVRLTGYALIAASLILAFLEPSPLLTYIGPINPVRLP